MSDLMIILILLLLPFAGFLALFGSGGSRWAGPVAAGLTGAGLILAGWLATHTPDGPQVYSTTWVTLGQLNLTVSLRLDTLTLLMLMVVQTVALLVQLYSIAYLDHEPKPGRYFAYLQLFVGAMLGIVLAGDLLVLYGFWELVGLASYLLIGFWWQHPASAQAASKAFWMNRIGDAGFLIGIFLSYTYFGTLDLAALTVEAPTGIGLCLFMGCVGKSAQFPLLTWLPDAMEGPTPVSALLHAATMVAAGVFLLARLHPVFSPDANTVIVLIGTLTTLWGGYSALYQHDIKKVLAFSTIAQLGLMVAGMGTGNVSGSLFHLLTHAFFKAGLFLGAGAVIHAVHTQDMRQMGGLRRAMPQTFVAYALCAASLAGVPLLSGFLSKETVLAGAFVWVNGAGGGLAWLVPGLLLLSSGLTSWYMTRQLRLIFFGAVNIDNPATPHDPVWLMRGPVWLLAGLSVGIWFSLNPLDAHESWFFLLLGPPPAESPAWLGLVSVALVAAGGWLGWTQPDPTPASRGAFGWVEASLHYGFLDEFYERVFVVPFLRLAGLTYRVDKKVVDGLVDRVGIGTVVVAHLSSLTDRLIVDGLVNGAGATANGLGRVLRGLQSGRIQAYIATAIIAFLLLLWQLL